METSLVPIILAYLKCVHSTKGSLRGLKSVQDFVVVFSRDMDKFEDMFYRRRLAWKETREAEVRLCLCLNCGGVTYRRCRRMQVWSNCLECSDEVDTSRELTEAIYQIEEGVPYGAERPNLSRSDVE